MSDRDPRDVTTRTHRLPARPRSAAQANRHSGRGQPEDDGQQQATDESRNH